MSREQSAMVKLGTVAPAFELMDVVTGKAVGRDDVFALVSEDARTDAANCSTTGCHRACATRARSRGCQSACGGCQMSSRSSAQSTTIRRAPASIKARAR